MGFCGVPGEKLLVSSLETIARHLQFMGWEREVRFRRTAAVSSQEASLLLCTRLPGQYEEKSMQYCIGKEVYNGTIRWFKSPVQSISHGV